MKELTVKQLAAISGVTVRTLHHYDEIGPLRPAGFAAYLAAAMQSRAEQWNEPLDGAMP